MKPGPVLVTGGFPTHLFTIDDDPNALRASLEGYHRMGRQATQTHRVLAATTVSSWTGSEGDLFRSRRASFEPMMTAAQEAFDGFHRCVSAFADELAILRSRMAALRVRAEMVWARLQAARAEQARAAASLATAAVAVPSAGPAAAVGAVSTAQADYAAAARAVAALESEWEECLREAERLHTEVAAAARQAAAAIGNLPRPPAVPTAPSGRAEAPGATAMQCRPVNGGLPDGAAAASEPGSGSEEPAEGDAEDERGFLSAGRHGLGALGGVAGSLNPFASEAERERARAKAASEMGRAGGDLGHAAGRVGNGLHGFAQVGEAGVNKVGAFVLKPLDKDASRRLDKAANDAWAEGSARVKKDGLYTVDVLSNVVGPGGLAKGAAVFGGKAVLGGALRVGGGTAVKAGIGKLGAAGLAPVLKGQRGVAATIKEIEEAGGQVLGREITLKHRTGTKWIKTRPDLYVELPNGTKAFVEVKNGRFARHTRNQRLVFPEIRAGNNVVPVGRRALDARLRLGLPLGATPVWTVYR